MQHFLITRFNLSHRDWKTTRSGNETGSEEWLKHRFELFENFCLPSVKNQCNQNFIWIVLFDRNTPVKYKQKIGEIESSYENLKVLYADGFPQLLPCLRNYISEKIENNNFIITTRLDNDDLIHLDFIQTIQKLAKCEQGLVIDLRMGYQTYIEDGVYKTRLYKEDPFNPFISVVEASENFNTVMSEHHSGWSKSTNVIVHKSKPLWIELVHDENKSNSPKNHMRMVRDIDYTNFGLSQVIPVNSRLYYLWNNFILVRLVRLLVRQYKKL